MIRTAPLIALPLLLLACSGGPGDSATSADREGTEAALTNPSIEQFDDAVVVVEILSEARAARQRAHAAVYAAAGVARFWQIRPWLRDVVVHTEPDPHRAIYGSVRTAVEPDELELVGRKVPVDRLLPPLRSP